MKGVGANQAEQTEAARYLGSNVAAPEIDAFVERQRRARRRMTLLLALYDRCPCRMSRIHLLTAAAVTIGRFCGWSSSFDAIGDALMPVAADGAPRTPAWARYIDACLANHPWELRDELWMIAHVEDMKTAREAGLDVAFYQEAATREHESTFRLLKSHMDMTLGARLVDVSAIQGVIPYETAMAQGMALAIERIVTTGWSLLATYAKEVARALLWPTREGSDFVSYRRTAVVLVRSFFSSWAAARVYSRGMRTIDRGRHQVDDGWSLLASVLGERVSAVDPMIVAFYENPSRFQVRAKLELHTAPARWWSRMATLLVGQGLYESDHGMFDARFRVFRRTDGSMHFIRELLVGSTLRVFDSDFVVRDVRGTATLFEVFLDLGVEVEMIVTALPDAGLSIRGREIFLRGLRMPAFGFTVEFVSRVVNDAAGKALEIVGQLRLQPRTRFGRWLAHRVLRRPEHLGSIHYFIGPLREAKTSDSAPPVEADTSFRGSGT